MVAIDWLQYEKESRECQCYELKQIQSLSHPSLNYDHHIEIDVFECKPVNRTNATFLMCLFAQQHA